jgi:hypothetical protein
VTRLLSLGIDAGVAVSWCDNHDRFAAVAAENPRLQAALPISGDITALAGIGLDAVTAIESGRARARLAQARQGAPRSSGCRRKSL